MLTVLAMRARQDLTLVLLHHNWNFFIRSSMPFGEHPDFTLPKCKIGENFLLNM